MRIVKAEKKESEERHRNKKISKFQPDTSLTHNRNEKLYSKMKSRSQSKESRNFRISGPPSVTNTNKMLLKVILGVL